MAQIKRPVHYSPAGRRKADSTWIGCVPGLAEFERWAANGRRVAELMRDDPALHYGSPWHRRESRKAPEPRELSDFTRVTCTDCLARIARLAVDRFTALSKGTA